MSDSFTETWLVGPTGTQFYTRTYTPTSAAKAILIFIHGFIEHIARYEHVFPSYAQHDIAVFAFDQRGFGRTALDPGVGGEREKERRTRKEGYGRTSSEQQKEDINWALRYAGEKLAGWGKDGQMLPVFLMGHSMGGGLVLSFGASPLLRALPHRPAGIIATSPLIAQTHPASRLLRKLGSAVSSISPWTTVPAGVNPDHLSHDKDISEAYMKDPLVQQYGTMKGVSTMLNLGGHISSQEYKLWPVELPVLLMHGTEDQVTSHAATQTFYNDIEAKDKTFTSYKDGFHELHNEPKFKERLPHEVISWVENHITLDSSTTPDARL